MPDSDKEEADELESDLDAEEYEDDGRFKIRDPLPLPTASVYSTLELHSMIHEGYIDLNPPYQRDVVWPQEKKIALIESIFRNFYIPPVLFLVTEDPESHEPMRICMDGKQRLTSIQAFFDGQIPYQDSWSKRKYFYTAPPVGKKLVIPDHFKEIFASKQITCVEYRGINGVIERDIFQRVQMGVTLTAAEKLAAISSPYADWITSLDAKHIRNEQHGLAEYFRWDSRRGKHFQNLAQMILCIENLPARTQPTSQRLATWLRRVDAPNHSLVEQIEKVLNTYWVIAADTDLKAPLDEYAKFVSPIEFVFIGVLIAVLDNSTNEAISKEIGNMRKDVRQHHKDIRANGQVISTLWDFIDRAKNRAGREGPTGAWRKRRRDDDHDNAEYQPTPIKVIGFAPTLRTRNGK